ncbi:MAG: hypothetical protein NZ519_09035 [Bacteroidia bacterium]|nr:hypothetical protein [Bacteroidia bacterium]
MPTRAACCELRAEYSDPCVSKGNLQKRNCIKNKFLNLVTHSKSILNNLKNVQAKRRGAHNKPSKYFKLKTIKIQQYSPLSTTFYSYIL